MYRINRFKLFVSFFVIFALSMLMLPINAAGEPWDNYSSYIPTATPDVKRDLRAAWISTVVNLDWPSAQTRDIKDDTLRIQKSKQELIDILDKAVEMNMNAVFFQVRTSSDALYKSNLVPWSRYLTGTFGKDPGFDPLAFAIEEAHKRNIELHAWLNPYRVSMDTSAATKNSLNIAKSVYKEHPEWIKTAANRFVLDPGIPAARAWIEDCVMEIVNNYDIDGIHFDDYFYNENINNEMGDDSTYTTYNNGQFSNKGDWRRNNTYLLIKELSQKIRQKKSWVKFGVSPSAIWANKKDHDGGSNTNSSYTNYDKTFADTKKWVNEEIIDYIAPQLYFSFGNTAAPYGELASWWANTVKGKKVQLYIGQALYKFNSDSDTYFTKDDGIPEITRQVKFNMSNPEIDGSIMFRFDQFFQPTWTGSVNALKYNLWKNKALVPAMPWKGGSAPTVPQGGSINADSSGVTISFTDNDSKTAYFAVYRFGNSDNIDTSGNSGSKLIGTIRKQANGTQKFTDSSRSDPNGATYVVTSLDRLHNESSGLKISYKSKYFSDVGQNVSWAIDSIDKLYENGIISSGGGSYGPTATAKRADFLVMLVKTLKLNTTFTDNFKDVPKGSYYYDAVGIAKALGIAKGSGGLYMPTTGITREDLFSLIYRALPIAGKQLQDANEDVLNVYSDSNKISSYARQAIAVFTKEGIIHGNAGKVNPKSYISRAEIAVILSKLID